MLSSSFLPCAWLALCLAPLLTTSPEQGRPLTRDEAFPPPRDGLSIGCGVGERPMRITELLDDFTRVTGIAVQMTPDTRAMAQSTTTGLNRAIDVPASEVYRIVETLLRANDFVAVHLSDVEPRVWSVISVNAPQRGGNLGADAFVVGEEELASWADHPATLITTTVTLPSTDVRTLSNALRTMFTDARTQNIIPVGEGNVIITGFAREVHGLVRILRRIDELAAADRERGAPRSSVPEPPKRQ